MTLLADTSRVVVSVLDNGKGLPELVVKFNPGSVGVGIAGMRQRIKEFGGELSLKNMNPGTLVEAVVPNRVWPTASAETDGVQLSPTARTGVHRTC